MFASKDLMQKIVVILAAILAVTVIYTAIRVFTAPADAAPPASDVSGENIIPPAAG